MIYRTYSELDLLELKSVMLALKAKVDMIYIDL